VLGVAVLVALVLSLTVFNKKTEEEDRVSRETQAEIELVNEENEVRKAGEEEDLSGRIEETKEAKVDTALNNKMSETERKRRLIFFQRPMQERLEKLLASAGYTVGQSNELVGDIEGYLVSGKTGKSNFRMVFEDWAEKNKLESEDAAKAYLAFRRSMAPKAKPSEKTIRSCLDKKVTNIVSRYPSQGECIETHLVDYISKFFDHLMNTGKKQVEGAKAKRAKAMADQCGIERMAAAGIMFRELPCY
jgi:hypothetical protein